VTKIALGDVSSVPVGQYAQDTFTALNIWDKVSAKAVFGSDVKQVLSWVSAGEVDCGVVYSTDAASDGTVKVVASAPADTHKAIVYPVGIVKASAQQTAAADFISYLQSDEGLAVFTKYGFLAG
jgi:molybdate transport system substrate-binding protein